MWCVDRFRARVAHVFDLTTQPRLVSADLPFLYLLTILNVISDSIKAFADHIIGKLLHNPHVLLSIASSNIRAKATSTDPTENRRLQQIRHSLYLP